VRRSLPFLATVLFIAVFGYLLQRTLGMYSPHALWKMLAVWALLLVAALRVELSGTAPRVEPRMAECALGLALVFFLGLLAREPLVVYAQSPQLVEVIRWMAGAGAALALAATGLAWRRHAGSDRSRALLAVAIGVLLFAVRVISLYASPAPRIDVFVNSGLAADYLLGGVNPYSQSYPDIYNGFYTYTPIYPYWPATLLIETLSRALTGDVRWGHVVADAVTTLALLRISARLGVERGVRRLIPLVWLALPVSLLVLVQDWVDLLLVTGTALFAWAWLAERRSWAAVALGALCAVKQYSVFLAILAGAMAWRSHGRAAALRLAGVSAAVFAALMVPFALWDLEGFYRQTILLQFTQDFRMDAQSIPIFLLKWRNWNIWGAPVLVIYVLALAGSLAAIWKCPRPRAVPVWSCALVLVYGTVFFFGKQAFCNYYYLLVFFAVLYLAGAAGKAPEDSARAR
jgi:hypothetical protein